MAHAEPSRSVDDGMRPGDGPLAKLRHALAERETVTWEDDGFHKPRLVVTFPEEAGPGDAVDALEAALADPGRDGRVEPEFLTLDGGWSWREVDTPEAARRFADASGNRIDASFARDSLPDGTLRDGRSYHALVDGRGHVAVVVAAGGRGAWGAADGPFALGLDGSDPYPVHSFRIRALAERIGSPLPRQCHPSYDADPDMRVAHHPARLPPHVMSRARSAARAAAVPLEEMLGVLVSEALDARESRGRG